MRTIERITKGLLFIALLIISTNLYAQKYWVGGAGDWQDNRHWSNTSGGNGGANLPTINDDVIFDGNSSLLFGDTINASGIAKVKSVDLSQVAKNVTFYADSFANLMVTGNIQFNAANKNQYYGYVVMVGSSSDYKLAQFNPGQFSNKTSFTDVYKNKRTSNPQPLAITSVTPNVIDATCGCDGEISLTINGGTGPFSYAWFPNVPPLNGDGTNTVIDLCPGKYNCIVTDLADGIPFIVSDIEVDGPSPLTIQGLAIDSVNCFEGSDGSINTLVFGGNAPYTLTWDDPSTQTTQNATNLAAGSYQLTAQDATGCIAVSPVYNVFEPTVLIATITDSTLVDCNGNCNGDATVSVSGGSPSYVYNWYNAPGTPTTALASNLCEGIYNVEVQDSRGCLDTTEVNITQPTTLAVSVDSRTNVTCFGFGDGTAAVSATGGIPTYTFDWYNVPGNPTLSNINSLSPGTYNVEVTDDNGCLDTTEITITEPTLLVTSISDTVHILCNGDATGEAEVTASGGTTAYTYNWYDGGGITTTRITNITAGTYNVQTTDGNGCLDTATVTIQQPATALSATFTDITQNLCFDDCDGIAVVTPDGGTAGYTYDWLNILGGNTDSTATNLCADTYNVEITDANGCTETVSIEITEPDELTGSATVTNVNCHSDETGEIDLTATGGTTNYNYNWYNVTGTPTSEDVTALADGTYNVEITDANGCIDTVEAIITEPDTLVATIISSTNILCNGLSTGSITATNSGGVGPFTFTWYNAPATPTGNTVNNLPAGTYNVEVRDANGCTDTAEVTLTEPALPITSSITDTVHILCKDVCSGEAEVAASGGVGGFIYEWYDVPGTPTVLRTTNLCDGTYHVEITDANGCLDTSEVTIREPLNPLTIAINDSSNASCNNVCDGEALITYSGGTAGYTIDWYTTGNQTTDTAFNLCAGPQFVSVTDANGCADTAVVFIEEPAALAITINSATLPTCFGDCDGEMSVTPSGGTEPYNYLWYDILGSPTTALVGGQCAGPYNVQVGDANGCLDTALVVLSQPDSLEHTIDSETDLLCKNVCEGEAEMTPIGGTAPYTVTWFDAPGTPNGTAITDLCAGQWNFELRDNNGCLDTGTVNLTEPALELIASITDSTNASCLGNCDGTATAAGSGGTGAYTYNWYNAPDTDTDVLTENLCAGTFNVEVTDANGCLDTADVVITQPTALNVDITDSVNASCEGECDGIAFVTYSGGTAGYTIDWYTAGNQTTDTAFNLCAGIHFVSVTDANGCADTAMVIIEEPARLAITINSATLPTCFGDCDGVMRVTPSGGTEPYAYLWTDVLGMPTTDSVAGQCQGSYNVRVEDFNGCLDSAVVVLSEPDTLEHTIDSETDLLCKNECEGEAEMTPIGGTAPYTVTWFDVPGTPTGTTVTDLCAGQWNFELRDANGCVDTGMVDLVEPALELISSITDTTHNLCFGDCDGNATVTASGGTGALTYSWYDAPDADTDVLTENLCAGTYNVEINDANGCLDTSTVTITNPAVLGFTTATDVSACGSLDTSKASVTPTGGTAPYTYNWYDVAGETTDTVTDLADGTYHCEITDANGCVDTAEITILSPLPIVGSIRADTVHVDCFGNCNGQATLDRTGGVGTYTQNWYDVPGTPTTRTATNLCAGIYHVEVADANGCVDTVEVEIREPDELISTADSLDATCFGICDGRVWTDYSGGIPPYDVLWYNLGNAITDTVDAVCAGTYSAQITDANGCLDTAITTVVAPVVVTTSIGDSTNNLCFNDCNGTASVVPVGGVLPYTYNWFNAPDADTDSIAENLCTQAYRVEVADANGCVDTATVTLTSTSPEIVGLTDSIPPSCVGDADGAAFVVPTGGIAPFTFDWYNAGNQTNDTATGLAEGIYFVEITDNLGCFDTATAVVADPDTLQAIISDTVNVFCFSDSTGSAIVTPLGGTPGYSYNWYNAPTVSTDSTVNGLPIGTFNVEVTDSKGCLDTGAVTIAEPTILELTSDSIPTSCFGICDGQAIVSASGGVAPYTYDWYTAGNQTTDTATGLCPGSYPVEVTDANGCLDTIFVSITEPAPLVASALDSLDALCNGSSDGWVALIATGGTAPYTYLWDDAANQTTDTAFNLITGIYKGIVTDSSGCVDSVSISVGEPTSITATDSLVNAACFNNCDGFIRVTAAGGTPGYTHSWNNGITDSLITGICAGTYTDTITDAAGCRDTFTYIITQPDSLQAIITDTLNILCFSDSSGEAIVTPIGGNAPYTYNWYNTPNNETDSTATGLPSGTFNVEVTDVNGCVDTGSVTITQNANLTLSTDSIPATCSGICTGSAKVNVGGGVGPYTYDWFTAGNQTTDSIFNLCADSYFVQVTDVNGCIDTAEAIVTEPVTITTIAVDSLAASCPESTDGWAAISALGGNLPYTYWWNDPLNQTTDTAFNLSGGTYLAAVIDVNGCSDTISITVDAPNPITPVDSLVNISCFGSNDGLIKLLSVSGGTAPYTHSWNTGSTDTILQNLTPGLYVDTITDGAGCVDTISFTIIEPDSLIAVITNTIDVNCSYSADGQAIVTPNGGTFPFTYDWYNVPGGDADSVASGILAGTYNVEVTDNNGCIDTTEVTINAPLAISITTDSVPATCSGVCDGIAIASATGGSGDLVFDWYEIGNLTNDSIYNVCADTFNVAVIDTNGCRDTASVIVTQPVTVATTIIDTDSTLCFGSADGSAVIAGNGGTAPYSYWWNDALNQTNDTATGLTAGTYIAVSIDANGCSDSIAVTILEPADWNHTKDSTPASCYTFCDGIITITPGGGTAPYTHSWDNGTTVPTVINLCKGVYTDTITDANGCKDTVFTVISEPDSLQAQPSVLTNVTCFGDSNAVVLAGAVGGTAPYTYEWGNPVFATDDSVLTIADTIRFVLTDSQGCTDTNQVIVTEPEVLTSEITDTVMANCLCNASATVTPAGGTAPYTYLWSDVAATTDSLATGLCAGSYQVEVTDSNGCSSISLVTIRDTSEFTISITDTTNISCFNTCDGGAIVTPSLGVEPYQYQWSTAANDTDSVVTNVCVGNINVLVTDSIGCVRFASVEIIQPDELQGIPQFTSPLCNGDTNGVAWVTPTGGTAPYTQMWDVPATNDTVYNIGVGTYTDTITDANGCMDTVQVVVTEPAILASTLDSINVSCFGSANGSAWSNTTGGTAPYSYEWNDQSLSTTDTIFNLGPNIYTAIVTDINGCSDTDSIAIVEPPLLTSGITDTSHVACFCTGTATVTPQGGTAPFSYLWSDAAAQTDSTATGLCSGNYQVVITDFNGCVDTSFVSIRDTSGFTTAITDTNMVTCFDACNGSATASASNGVQPYNFLWNDPSNTNDALASGLCAGNYTVTISDAIGCTHNLSITITQPDSLMITLSDTATSCNTFCDGAIIATVSGGTMPYASAWNNPASSSDTLYVDSLCAGPITLEVNDANGCFATKTDTITEPAELVAFINPFTPISCNGENDASFSALGTGGTLPYNYSWNTGSTNQDLTKQTAGTYILTITDTNNCVDDTSLIVTEPNVLITSITDTTHILCGGLATGSATVTPIGGTAPYIYSWFNAPGTPTDSVATNLPAGDYAVRVIDANGCFDTAFVTITEPAPFNTTISNFTNTSCLVCDGTAAVTPNGGVAPFTYNWYNTPGLIADSLATGLCASTFEVEVTDANGCADTSTVTIVAPNGLTATIADSTMVSCNNTCDGLAVATGIAGTAPYNYTWDDVNATQNDSLSGLCVGTYTATITDAAGCLATATVTITEPDELFAVITNTTATGCAAPCNGVAVADGLGGTAPYTFSWNDFNSQTTQTASNLCAGSYITTVQDANGCIDTTTAVITGPAGLTLLIDSIASNDCFDDCEGSIAVTAQGGVGNYSFSWNDPANSTDSVVTGLCADDYIGQVTDGNGCVAFINATIIHPTELVIAISDSSDANCANSNEGWAVVSYSGGTAPYTVLWNDAANQNTDTASNLLAGTYTVIVTDANGCQKQTLVTIDEPSQLTVNTSNIVNVSCSGFCVGQASLVVTGGTTGGGYTYIWENGQTSPAATNLCAGFQTYSVSDANGCTVVDSVEIQDINNFTAVFTKTDLTCNDVCDGSVNVTPSGGVAPYTHAWQHGPTTPDLAGLCAGTYIDTVFDNNGCFLVDSITVIEPQPLVTTITDSANLTCFGNCDGYAVANATGGTGDYTYTWYNSPGNQVNDTAFNLCATTYFVRTEDENGCISEDTISLTQPSAINVSVDASTPATCFGLSDASATVSANGGQGTLIISWEDGDINATRNDLMATNYTVYATDDSSCVDSVTFTIGQPDSLFAVITDTTHLICSTTCNGEATVGENGGTAPYSYNWYDAGNANSNIITGLCADTFHVEVRDANNCLDTAQVIINNDRALQVNLNISNISCNGECDGKMVPQITGGVEDYTLSWSNGSSADSLENLCASSLTLTVTDFENCQTTISGSIIEPAPLSAAVVSTTNLECFEVCDGSATVSPQGGTAPYNYSWDDVANQDNITATGLCADDYNVTVTDARGCIADATTTISQPNAVTIDLNVTQANCTNVADGAIEVTVNGGTPNFSYNWTGENNFASTSQNISALALGKYIVNVTDANGCGTLDSATITEVNFVNANAGNDTTICDASEVTLRGSGGALYSWTGGGNAADYTVSPTSTTDYILSVFNNGCTDADTVTVTVNSLPEVTAIVSDNLILNGTSAQLSATGAGTGAIYDWNPPIGLNDPTIPNPITTLNEAVTYTVTGTDVNGCSDTAMINIDVASTIIFPDGITPNGDGLNETWVIQLIEEFPQANVQIYNRWGQIVFASKGYVDEWDGTVNGKELPVGTYYYLIDLGSGREKLSGPITLMR